MRDPQCLVGWYSPSAHSDDVDGSSIVTLEFENKAYCFQCQRPLLFLSLG